MMVPKDAPCDFPKNSKLAKDVLEMINERTSTCNAALSLIASLAMTSTSKD